MADEKLEMEIKVGGKPHYLITVPRGRMSKEAWSTATAKVIKVVEKWVEEGGVLALPDEIELRPLLVELPEMMQRLEALEDQVEGCQEGIGTIGDFVGFPGQ